MNKAFSLQAVASAALAAFAFSAIAAPANAASDPTGVWVADTGRGAVEIKPCGKNLCGHVVAVKSDNDTKGCGKQIIGDAQSVGGGRWDNGWIYSPEKRRNYDVELKPLSDGTLRVVGYAGTKLFSRTMIWTRAPADLKRCDTPVVQPVVKPDVKPDTKPELRVEAKPEVKADAPVTAQTAPAPAPPAIPEKAASAPSASLEIKPAAKPLESTPEPTSDNADGKPAVEEPPSETASSEDEGERSASTGPDLSDLDLSNLDLKKLKIGDVELGRVLTRSKSGTCKLDLPWLKVRFECER